MTALYRLMRPDDETMLINLWAANYEDDPIIISHAFRSDPQCFERTYVAQAIDGTLQAGIVYWIRSLRDTAGIPRRVGHIWGVGTPVEALHPEYQQHTNHLLNWAMTALERESCEAAITYPVSDHHKHYQQYGWQLFPNTYRQGAFSGIQLPTEGYSVRPYHPRQEQAGWQPLIDAYQMYNAMRSGSVVRDMTYWQSYLSWRWEEWETLNQTLLLVATPTAAPENIVGYIIPKFYPETFLIAELAVQPEHIQALPVLFAAVMDEARRRDVARYFRVYLPSEPTIDVWLHDLFGQTMHEGTSNSHAIFSLNSQQSDSSLVNMFLAPSAYGWLLDQF
jgi:hypothetical protein